MSRRFCLVVALCACGLAQFAAAQEFTTRIIAVLDGDTVLIRQGNGMVKIRLAEIDAPEVAHPGRDGQTPNPQKAQAFGETARRSLSEMVSGKEVRVVSQAVDVYGRMVARLNLNGLDVNAEQVRRGMAWDYSHYHSNKNLVALEAEARQASRGLWAQRNPTPPWEWRRQHPDTYTARQPTLPDAGQVDCTRRKHCSDMQSCEQARHYLAKCGGGTLDGDGDGVPCEKLCRVKKLQESVMLR